MKTFKNKIQKIMSAVLAIGLIVGGSSYAAPKGGNSDILTVNWTTTTLNINESAGLVTLRATVTGSSRRDVSVPFTVSGTTSNPTDHNLATSGELVIPSGATEATLQFNLVNDTAFELAETMTITLNSSTRGRQNYAIGTTPTLTLNIADDDTAPTVQFRMESQRVVENSGRVSITAELSAASGLDVTVPYTVSGTATPNSDHSLASGNLRIAAGANSANLDVTLVDDTIYEGDETLIVTLGAPSNASLGARTVHTVTIADNETIPTLSFDLAAQTVLENAGTASVKYTLSNALTKPVTAKVTVTGTAKNPEDHNAVDGTILLNAGDTTGEIRIAIVDDTIYEGNKTIILTISEITEAALGRNPVHTLTIQDNEVQVLPVVQWSSAVQTIQEDAGMAMISVNIDKVWDAAITVPYVVSGTSTRPADHDLANGTLTIAAGQLTSSAAIMIVNDALYEGDETLIVTLGAPTNATLGATAAHVATIVDNDPMPNVQFALANQSVTEAAGTVTANVSLDTASGRDVTVSIGVTGTATAGTDHTLTAGNVVIPAGTTTRAVTFNVTNDNLYETDETVILTLSNPMGATLGTQTNHTVTIQNDDQAPTVQFASATQTVQESTGRATVNVTLSALSGLATTVNYVVSGSATAVADHSLANGSLTIAAGQSSAMINFNIVSDTVIEPDETVIITLSTPQNATLGGTSTHTVTITDTVATPTLEFAAASQAATEAAGTVNVSVRLNAPSATNISVPYTVSGTAVAPADHSLANGTLNIAAGQTMGTVSFSIVNDTLDEIDETVILTLGNPTGATLGTIRVHTVTIADDDNAPVIQFSTTTQSVNESVGAVNITASISAVSGKAVTATFTVSGTSSSPSDHNLPNGTINIPAGTNSAVVSFAVVNDTLNEGDETVIVTLAGTTNATLGTNTAHTVTIVDDDLNSTVSLGLASQNLAESIGTMNIAVNLSSPSAQAVAVPYTVTGTATSPADHNLTSGTVTIAAGATTANIALTIVNDNVFEGNETVIITLGNPSVATVLLGTTRVYTGTIIDDETQPQVSFALAMQTISETAGMASVTVNLTSASGVALNIPYTVSGTAASTVDHNLASGTLSIAAGTTSRALTFNIVNDALYEANETVIITLGASTGYALGTASVHTATITNDDAAPVVQLSVAAQSVTEAAGAVTVTASLSAVSGLAVDLPFAVTGTATATTDFTVSANRFSIPAGSTSANVTVNVVNDTLNEDNETVILTLGTPAGATAGAVTAHTITVQDDDAMPIVQWSVAAQNADENSGTANARATLSAASGKAITVSYTVGGTANNVTAGRTKYTLAPGTITFAAGTTQRDLAVTLINDTVAGPSDFNVVLTLASPVSATLGLATVHTITIIDNDTAATNGMEGYRLTVWPLVRQRCTTCHASSTFLPNHASDDLATGHSAALARVNFADIPNSRMVLKSADGHCGTPALCTVTGSTNDTRPLMIAAIQSWATYEASTSPTPTPTPPATMNSGTLAFRDAPNYLEYVTNSVGLSSDPYQYNAPYSNVILNLSQDGDVTGVSGPMLLAYTTVAAKVCEDFVNREKGFALNSSSRIAFGPIDFNATANIGTAVLSQANIDTVTNNLARLFWRRDALATEKTETYNMISTAIAGRTLGTTDTSRLMVISCVTAATTLESIQY